MTAPDPTYNLSAFADRLFAEKRLLPLANQIRRARDLHSLSTDLVMATESIDALEAELTVPADPDDHRKLITESALLGLRDGQREPPLAPASEASDLGRAVGIGTPTCSPSSRADQVIAAICRLSANFSDVRFRVALSRRAMTGIRARCCRTDQRDRNGGFPGPLNTPWRELSP